MVSGMNEYIERLEKAIRNLYKLRSSYTKDSREWVRISGKIEGVELALSYYREMPV